MLKRITKNQISFDVEIGNVTAFRTLPGDKLILPVDSGVRFDVSEDFPDIIGSRSFNSRELTVGMLLLERGGCFLGLIPRDTVNASCRVYKNTSGLLEAEIKSTSEVIVRADTLPELIAFYRELRKDIRVTLRKKAECLPLIDRLARSAIVYIWHDDYERLMYSTKDERVSVANPDGILRVANCLKADELNDIMFGIFFDSDQAAVNELSRLGFMTSKYDNYCDVPPSELCKILTETRINECAYLKRRIGDAPDRIRVNSDGSLTKAWELEGLDGKRHSQYGMCAKCSVEAMKREIPEEIRGKNYSARFIDVFGTSLSDCFSSEHGFTREESVEIKRSAFAFLEELGLIPGTEDGCELFLTSLCYNEGIESPIFFRYDWRECGRKKARLYESSDAADWFRKYMLDPEHRFPLFELCWHDCMISFPYWGDSILCCPEVMPERILMAALFAAPPLFSFFESDFDRLEPMIVEAYRRLHPVLEAVGTLPMTSFERIGDRLYKSSFEGGIDVVANFAKEEALLDRIKIYPLDFVLIGV